MSTLRTSVAHHFRTLARLHREQAEVELAIADALGRQSELDTFSSHDLPPDCRKRRTFDTWCRTGRVEGAFRLGRTWCCRRDAWLAARTSRRPSAEMLIVNADAANDVGLEELADSILAASGLCSVG